MEICVSENHKMFKDNKNNKRVGIIEQFNWYKNGRKVNVPLLERMAVEPRIPLFERAFGPLMNFVRTIMTTESGLDLNEI